MAPRTPRSCLLLLVACLATAACAPGDDPADDARPGRTDGAGQEPDVHPDAGPDAAADGGPDSGPDAGPDGAPDATPDGEGPPADGPPADAGPPRNGLRVLFDTAHGQTAGNADWVIDHDSGRHLSPAEPTGPTDWSGGNSAFGYELHRAGYTLEQLPPGEVFSYGTTAPQDLSQYHVVVAVEPNTAYTGSEAEALRAFVQAGGGLLMVGDHIQSDRDGDGIDSVGIWNAVLQVPPGEEGPPASPSGLRFNADNFSVDLPVASTDPRSAPLLAGPFGAVRAMHLYGGCSLAVAEPAFALLHRETAEGGLLIGAAAAQVGAGRLVAVGDSTPTSDGSGEGIPSTFPWYDGRYGHRALFLNATAWLARAAP